jgi:type II secretory pathway pseudopilin PulG
VKKSFSLIEILIVIAVISAMAIFTKSYISTDSIFQVKNITLLKSQVVTLTTMLLKCKSKSSQFPKYNGTNSNDNLFSLLQCPTSPPYDIVSSDSLFSTQEVDNLSSWYATENTAQFVVYVKTTNNNLNTIDVLKAVDSKIENSFLTKDTLYTYFNIKFEK